jgi:hypothetical protein
MLHLTLGYLHDSFAAAGAPEPSIIDRMFRGHLLNTVTCSNCGHQARRTEPFVDLPLAVPTTTDPVDLQDLILGFFATDSLDGASASYRCDKCHQRTKATRTTAIAQYPEHLILNLKRVHVFRGGYRKNDSPVILPTQPISLAQYAGGPAADALRLRTGASPPTPPATVGAATQGAAPTGNASAGMAALRKAVAAGSPIYDLKAVVSHKGSSMSSGHYFAQCVDLTGSWHTFDDQRVRPTPFTAFSPSREAVILLLERRFSPAQHAARQVVLSCLETPAQTPAGVIPLDAEWTARALSLSHPGPVPSPVLPTAPWPKAVLPYGIRGDVAVSRHAFTALTALYGFDPRPPRRPEDDAATSSTPPSLGASSFSNAAPADRTTWAAEVQAAHEASFMPAADSTCALLSPSWLRLFDSWLADVSSEPPGPVPAHVGPDDPIAVPAATVAVVSKYHGFFAQPRVVASATDPSPAHLPFRVRLVGASAVRGRIPVVYEAEESDFTAVGNDVAIQTYFPFGDSEMEPSESSEDAVLVLP